MADFENGTYSALCPREKELRTFYGVVRLTDEGRVLAEGFCDCATPMASVLVSP